MSFFGLARYGSDDERPAFSDTSSEDDSDASGDDDDEGVGPSSTGAAAPAAAPAPKTVLPSANDVFGAVTGPPAFLRPEATRPLASAHRHPADGDGTCDMKTFYFISSLFILVIKIGNVHLLTTTRTGILFILCLRTVFYEMPPIILSSIG